MEYTGEINGSLIAEIIRKRIIDCEYVTGQKLVEKNLCDEFGVSRTLVREAFRLLQNEGLLVHVPEKGVRVADFGKYGAMDLQELRGVLECFSAKKAASCATEEQIAHLRKVNQELRNFDKSNSAKSM